MNFIFKVHELYLERHMDAMLEAASNDRECPSCRRHCKQKLLQPCDAVLGMAAQTMPSAWEHVFSIARHLVPFPVKVAVQVVASLDGNESPPYVQCSHCNFIWAC